MYLQGNILDTCGLYMMCGADTDGRVGEGPSDPVGRLPSVFCMCSLVCKLW